MRGGRVVVVGCVVAVFVVLGIGAWLLLRGTAPKPVPGCTVAAPPGSANTGTFALSPEQTGYAATIAGVGVRDGMPPHAVTIAIATALQESKLANLAGGDRDSAGLFQQRPSQGWGSHAQITDPVYASAAFYDRLRAVPGWTTLPVTEAAQAVQRSAGPDAYADWESEARAIASALTGQTPAGLTCHDVAITPTGADIASTARTELGTGVLSGKHDPTSGWRIAAWLVGHSQRLGVDRVSFAGRTWTAQSGAWSAGTGPATLSLHRASAAR